MDKVVVEKIIRSLRSGGLKTSVARCAVENGEVLRLQFGSEQEYQRLLKIRTFVPATETELLNYVNRSIPIIQEDTDIDVPINTLDPNQVVPQEYLDEQAMGEQLAQNVEMVQKEGIVFDIETKQTGFKQQAQVETPDTVPSRRRGM